MVNARLVLLAMVFSCLAWVLPAGVARSSEGPYRLGDLETLVLERSPLVNAAEERLSAARREIERIRYTYGPEVVLRAGYEDENRIEPTNPRGDLEYRVSGRVQQDLVDLFRIKPLKAREAKAEQEVAESDLAEARSKAVHDLRQTYLQGLEEKLQAEAYGRIADLYQQVLVLRQKRYKAAEELPSEVRKAEKEFVAANALQRHHADFLSTVKLSLAQSAGAPPERIDFSGIPVPSVAEEGQFVYAARDNRPFVRKFQAKAKQEKSRGAMSGLDTVRLYPYVGYHVGESVSEGSTNGPEVGVVFSMPLMAGLIQDRGVERSRHLAEAWKMEERQVIEDVQKQIRDAYGLIGLEESRIAAASKAIEVTESEIKIEKARLQSPVAAVPADQGKVIELEAEVLKSRLEKDLSEAKKASIYFELLYLAGLDAPPPGDGQMAKPAENSGAKSAETPAPKALWVWKTERLLDDGPLRKSLLEACRGKKTDRVYLSVNKSIMEKFPEHQSLARLLSELHQAGASVSALLGESNWVYPAKREQLTKALEKIGAFNRMHEPPERFDSVHLDIEPQGLKEWKNGGATEKRQLLANLLDTCRSAREKLPSLGEKVRLEVDIPLSYKKTSPDSLDGIIAAADTIVLMAYEITDREKLAGATQVEIEAVCRQGKRVVVGLRAKDFSSEAELERFVSGVREGLRGSACFDGFAIHDFDQYRDLLTR